MIFNFVIQSTVIGAIMTDKEKSLKDLSEIRNIMERSTQFLSLSGLSGVFAGLYALVAAWFVYYDFASIYSSYGDVVREMPESEFIADKIQYALTVGALVLFLSLLTGIIMTKRKAAKSGNSLWSKASKNMIINLSIPLLVGGMFCMLLIHHNAFGLVAPATLIFYGLALVNASKYTLRDIKYLGLLEIALGLISAYFIGYGLIVWAIGFGVLHIIYGLSMYVKYDRK